MPGKKRKAESASQNMWGSSSSPTSPSRRNNKQSSSSRRGGGGASGGSGAYQRINEDSASKLFDEICDEDDPNVAGMEGECIFCHCVQLSSLFTSISKILTIKLLSGICKLCEQLQLDPLEDVRVLVLLHKLGANKKPAEISREEWMSGCNRLQLDTVAKFTNYLPALDTGFMDRDEFKEFYKVCILYNEILLKVEAKKQ